MGSILQICLIVLVPAYTSAVYSGQYRRAAGCVGMRHCKRGRGEAPSHPIPSHISSPSLFRAMMGRVGNENT
ncbi:hypothetical protein F5X98DRAFT_329567 [Xylaria grammica]|nr:hypothetical protein F5X98DRAFT_329567 [Xylaria grammica]